MDLIPYQSVGSIRFGMMPDEVETELGRPIAKTKNFLNEVKFVYPGFNVEFSAGGMEEVTINSSQHVTIHGHSILESASGRDALLAMSKSKYQGNGSLVLMDIGVAMPDQDGPPFPLTAFARDRMKPLLANYEQL